MCGLAASLDEKALERMGAALSHRGIRSKILGPIFHVRLPIVGLDEAHDQPKHSGRHTIAFVGELLDYKSYGDYECDFELLCREVTARGPTSLIGHDGFWAVIDFDEVRRQFMLICDYLAQKPLYYRIVPFAAASELDAIALAAPVTPNELYFSDVLKWGYCPDPRQTPYKEVMRVLPGETVIVDALNDTFSRGIVDPLRPRSLSFEETRTEIELAVRRRVMSSDVPVACLTSGGLDSSIVFELARRHGEPRAYFVDVGNGDDLRNVERLDPRNLTITKVPVDIDTALAIMQEPIDLGSLVPQCMLSAAVKERVCLTGDGADEMFGGYGRAHRYDSQYSDVFHELPCWHLPRLDRVMMRNKIEVRSPFLARRVVEGALALPRDLRTGKLILTQLFGDLLPKEILLAPKRALRTKDIEHDREGHSVKLVNKFRKAKWG